MASKSLGVLTLDLVAKIGGFEQGMTAAERSSDKWRKRVESDMRGADASSQKAFSSIASNAAKAAGAIGLVLSTKQIIDYADSWSDLNSRVANAVGPGAEAERVMGAIAATARSTYSALDQTAEAFLNNATALTELGYSTDKQLQLSDALNNALVISATKGAQADSVMLALSKSIASGTLRGENWNTVLQSGGRIVQALADGLGVTTIELRKMAADGLLTTEKVVNSLTSQTEKLREESAAMAATFSDGVGQIGNSLLALVGITDQATGASSSLADNLVAIADAISPFDDTGNLKEWADNLHLVADAAAVVGIAIGARLASSALVGAAAIVTQTQATAALAGATARQSAVALAAAQVERASAIAKLESARLNVALATTEAQLTAAITARTRAAAAAAASSLAVNAASAASITASAVAMRTATVAASGLAVAARAANAALALVGGPLGAIILAAGALLYFTTRGKEATEQTIALTTAVKDLNDIQRDVATIEATRRIEELSEQAKTLADNLKFAEENSEGAGRRAKRYSEDAAFLRVALSEVNDEIQTYQDRLTELAGSENTIADTADTASEAFQKLNKQLRERFILVGLNSEADKLAARIAAGYVEGLEEGEGDILVALQRQIDAREKNIKAIESAGKTAEAASKARAAEEKSRLEGIATEITAIERAALVWGLSADEVKLYDLTVQGATDAQLMHARALQETVAGFEKTKKNQQDYLRLVQDLRTEEEKLTDQLHAQLAVLDAIAASGGIGSDEYRQTAGRITEGLFEDSKAPSFAGVDAGPLGELSKLDDAEKELQKWYDSQLEMLAVFREERSDLNEEWDEREREIKQQHEDALAAIERSRWQVGLDSLDGILTDMQALRESDNKKGQQAAKAAAIVQATINAYTAATGAYASASAIPVVGWVLGPVAAAAALAAGLANVSAIQGMAHDGIDSIPQTGTWLLEKGERVTTANTSARLDDTLARIQGDMDEQRGGRQSGRGGFTLNQTNNFGSPDNRTATQVATATARRQRTASARLGS